MGRSVSQPFGFFLREEHHQAPKPEEVTEEEEATELCALWTWGRTPQQSTAGPVRLCEGTQHNQAG
jgi:hypothetical protein